MRLRHRNRKDSPPIDDPALTSFSCDWGNCDNETVAWRWDDEHHEWLPVCADHAEDVSA